MPRKARVPWLWRRLENRLLRSALRGRAGGGRSLLLRAPGEARVLGAHPGREVAFCAQAKPPRHLRLVQLLPERVQVHVRDLARPDSENIAGYLFSARPPALQRPLHLRRHHARHVTNRTGCAALISVNSSAARVAHVREHLHKHLVGVANHPAPRGRSPSRPSGVAVQNAHRPFRASEKLGAARRARRRSRAEPSPSRVRAVPSARR